MTTLLNGALGGALAGLLAAVAAVVVDRYAPSATAHSRPVDAHRSTWVVLAAGTAYGGVAGTAALALELYAVGLLAVPPTTVEAFAAALAWSAVLLGLNVVALHLTDARERSLLAALVAYHVVYGVDLGLWIRATWIT